MRLSLTRPLVFFDLETTGLNVSQDRIIEYCFIKIFPDGRREQLVKRVSPLRAISHEAQEITGISAEDLVDCLTFDNYADDIFDFLKDSDLAGYNILRFDIPVLNEEFKRCDIEWKLGNHHIVDMQRIFHQKEKRDLAAALQFYGGEELVDAHAAEVDVEATIKVFEGQLEMYDDLPSKIEEVADFCKDARWVDRTGRIHWVNGEASLAFSKKKGVSLREMAKSDKGMLNWVLNNDFPDDVKDIIRDALNNKFPEKP